MEIDEKKPCMYGYVQKKNELHVVYNILYMQNKFLLLFQELLVST